MGKDPDQIERAIRDHREAISRRISDLQGRVQKDLESVRSEAQARANGAVEQAKGAFDIESQVRDHPMSSLAGAFGAGVLLGVISYRGNGGAPPAPPPSRGQLGGSFLGDIAEQFVFVPNISYPTDQEIGLRLGKEIVVITPPPLAWGDSPPWPYDEESQLVHSYRASLTQIGRLLLIAALRANPEKVAKASKSELPVGDQFKATHPTWEEQFTALFVAAAVALYFMYYNFGRVHQTLRVTPAMEAGIADHVWSIEEIVGLIG